MSRFIAGQDGLTRRRRTLVQARVVLGYIQCSAVTWTLMRGRYRHVAIRSLTGVHLMHLQVSHKATGLHARDQIVVLEAGRVVEAGTPAELLAAGGRFASMLATLEAVAGH